MRKSLRLVPIVFLVGSLSFSGLGVSTAASQNVQVLSEASLGSGVIAPALTTSDIKASVADYLQIRSSVTELRASRSRHIKALIAELKVAKSVLADSNVDGSQIMSIANDYVGVPYRRGGTSPTGFDCSGYTQYVFAKAGIKLPRVAGSQANYADKISATKAVPGDLVFFHAKGGIYHVGIYAGKGRIWHSPRPGKNVEKVKIWTSRVTFGRVPDSALDKETAQRISDLQAEIKQTRNQLN